MSHFIMAASQQKQPQVVATGGDEVFDINVGGVDYRVHKFTSSGNFEVTAGGNIEYLVVGGGGAGGANTSSFWPQGCGGGGAGGLLEGSLTISANTHAISVGAGASGNYNSQTEKGEDSSIASLVVAVGGGTGGGNPNNLGLNYGFDGGSGGGLLSANNSHPRAVGISGQGHDGGCSTQTTEAYCNTAYSTSSSKRGGGGGGGAGEEGVAPPHLHKAGSGGDGVQRDIDGTMRWYAGGGGGGYRRGYNRRGSGGNGGGGDGGDETVGLNGSHGSPNTGGGGGGAGGGRTATIANGGNGGSGIVIIRYEI